ncbi:response regulator transcription factor [Isoptericola halotolerans]|uniref:DNA-binding NarL/FixJ family response regulator n=1 Tax=Isoptericola halotolerans TaxID=300560 RepID=A0ABX2A6I8_9MICO|nr:response regulator transcription factor [Isoptericola halotolerans]NOV98438.1 DNA-binding NarL/FixJ family response regulator [Isoptericola halotolerans]
MTSHISVVVVDDDPLVRAGLRLILGGAPEVEVVADAGDGAEGVEVVRRERPDVVLMDIRMPRTDGIEATRIVSQSENPPRVIVLTTFDTDDMVLQALRAGAAGFLLKDTPPDRLVAAVRAAASGEPTLSPSVMHQLIAQVSRGGAAGPDGSERHTARRRMSALTDREREVAAVLARGRSNAEIAAELFMSVPTVKTHVSRILDKLGAANRVQAAIAIHDAGSP